MAEHFKSKFILGLTVVLIALFLIFKGIPPKEEKINSVQTTQKVIALTFDDGPHPIYTPQLLDILSKNNVKATFFMIGASIKKYPLIVKQVVAKGHAIGNHTYTHPLDLTVCTEPRIIRELKDSQSIIRQVTGQQVFIFRPPRGIINKKVVKIIKKNGYQTILWSVCGDKHQTIQPSINGEVCCK